MAYFVGLLRGHAGGDIASWVGTFPRLGPPATTPTACPCTSIQLAYLSVSTLHCHFLLLLAGPATEQDYTTAGAAQPLTPAQFTTGFRACHSGSANAGH